MSPHHPTKLIDMGHILREHIGRKMNPAIFAYLLGTRQEAFRYTDEKR